MFEWLIILILSLIAIVKGSCNHERLPFTTLGGMDPDPAAYTHTSTLPSFRSGFTICFHYRYIPSFTSLDQLSRYYLLDINSRIVVTTAYSPQADIFVTLMILNLISGVKMVPIPLIPQLWSSICFIHDRTINKLSTMHRFGIGLSDVWNTYDVGADEEILGANSITFGNSTFFVKGRDKSFPSAISNVFIANYPLDNLDSGTLSYIHRESKPWLYVLFAEDSDKFIDLINGFEHREDDTRGFMKTAGHEPTFKNGRLSIKGAQSVSTIGDMQVVWLPEYNILTKDPTVSHTSMIVLELLNLPFSGSAQLVYVMYYNQAFSVSITHEGIIQYKAGSGSRSQDLSAGPLPINQRIELSISFGINLMLRIYEVTLFVDSIREGKIILTEAEASTNDQAFGGAQFSVVIGSAQESALEFNLLFMGLWDGILIPDSSVCRDSNSNCKSRKYIRHDSEYGCLNCLESSQIAVYREEYITTQCLTTNPNNVVLERFFVSPFKQTNLWIDCLITQFSGIGCPLCHPSCLSCINEKDSGCISCHSNPKIFLKSGRCLVISSDANYTLQILDTNSIIILSNDKTLEIDDNVEVHFDGWEREKDYDIASFTDYFGKGKKLSFTYYKAQFEVELNLKIYSVSKSLFQAALIQDFKLTINQNLNLIAIPQSESSYGISDASKTIINLELLIAIFLPYIGGFLQKMTSFALLLVSPLRLPRRTGEALSSLIPLQKVDFLGVFISQLIDYKQKVMETALTNNDANFVPIYSKRNIFKLFNRIVALVAFKILKPKYIEHKNGHSKKQMHTLLRYILLLLFKVLKATIQTSLATDLIYITFSLAIIKSPAELLLAYIDLVLIFLIHNEYFSFAKAIDKIDRVDDNNELTFEIANIYNEENHFDSQFDSLEFWIVDNFLIFAQIIMMHLLKHYPTIYGIYLVILFIGRGAYKCSMYNKKKVNYILEAAICSILQLSWLLILLISDPNESSSGFMINLLIFFEIFVFISFDIGRITTDLLIMVTRKRRMQNNVRSINPSMSMSNKSLIIAFPSEPRKAGVFSSSKKSYQNIDSQGERSKSEKINIKVEPRIKRQTFGEVNGLDQLSECSIEYVQ